MAIRRYSRRETNSQLYIPYPSFARNSTYETTNAVSSYNSLQVTYEHQLSAGLYLLGNYTWSKVHDRSAHPGIAESAVSCRVAS